MKARVAPASAASPELASWVGPCLLGALLALLALRVVGVLGGFLQSIGSPTELDYGEGIVWQQAALILGPRAYGSSPALPFIVFHYPPLYHLAARAAGLFMPNLLAAGRLVSAVSALAIAPLVAGIVVVAAPRPAAGTWRWLPLAAGVVAGLLAVCLHAVRLWGLVMRVDMLAIALSLAGVLVAARADGRFGGVLAGLLLCLASVYTKQTELPAGVAVFLVALGRRPRVALAAGCVALSVGLGVLAALQLMTHGGFLHNILGDNVNRVGLRYAARALWPERSSLAVAVLALVAARSALDGLRLVPGAGMLARLRAMDRAHAARALVLLHFGLATLMLFTIAKSGGNFNYLIEWLCVGAVLIGMLLCDLATHRRGFAATAAVLLVLAALMPQTVRLTAFDPANVAADAALVRRIAAADKPVMSENMTLLMQAGKQVWFEPSIVQELVALGHWDETPLLRMIRAHGFAFMVTEAHTGRMTPGILAAMHAAYPRTEAAGPHLVVHLPP